MELLFGKSKSAFLGLVDNNGLDADPLSNVDKTLLESALKCARETIATSRGFARLRACAEICIMSEPEAQVLLEKYKTMACSKPEYPREIGRRRAGELEQILMYGDEHQARKVGATGMEDAGKELDVLRWWLGVTEFLIVPVNENGDMAELA